MTTTTTTEFFSIHKSSGFGFAVLDTAGNEVVAYRSKKTAEEAARGATLVLFGAAEAYDFRRTHVKAYLAARASRVAPVASAQLEMF